MHELEKEIMDSLNPEFEKIYRGYLEGVLAPIEFECLTKMRCTMILAEALEKLSQAPRQGDPIVHVNPDWENLVDSPANKK